MAEIAESWRSVRSTNEMSSTRSPNALVPSDKKRSDHAASVGLWVHRTTSGCQCSHASQRLLSGIDTPVTLQSVCHLVRFVWLHRFPRTCTALHHPFRVARIAYEKVKELTMNQHFPSR